MKGRKKWKVDFKERRALSAAMGRSPNYRERSKRERKRERVEVHAGNCTRKTLPIPLIRKRRIVEYCNLL